MGVSYFYRHLIESFPYLSDALKALVNTESVFLYLDFNANLHPCVGKIITKYVNMEVNNIDKQKMEQEMFEEIRNHTLELVQKFKPDFLFIAVDGIAPKAKMVQQRTRRYKSVIEKRDRRKIFDTNAISPSTPWMKRLTTFMEQFIVEELGKECKVLFSSAEEEQEGEHKILNFINNFKYKKDVTHIINSLDADLIMLSLASGLDNIYLLREKQEFEKKNENKEEKGDKLESQYNLLPINKLKDYLWEYTNKNNHISDVISKDNFTRDYLILMFLIGNDFLPKMKIINVKKFGIELLLEKYSKYLKVVKKPLLDENNDINQKLLLLIFQDLAKDEMTYIKQNVNQKMDKVIRYHEKGWQYRYYKYYLGLYKVCSNSHFFNDFNRQCGKDRYYCKKNDMKYEMNRTLDGFNVRFNKKDINDMCKNYFEMFKWVVNYYFKEGGNWSMSYKYLAAPIFSDLFRYLQNNNLSDITIENDTPYNSIQQLLLILPPQSDHLIDTKYHPIMKRFNLWFPKNFQLDCVNRDYRYQWCPILPIINDKLIHDNIMNIDSQ